MNKSVFHSLMLAGLVVVAVMAASSTTADDGPAQDREFAEMQEQLQQMRADMEELRAMLEQLVGEREADKQDSDQPELPPELAEQMHDIKREIQEPRQAGHDDEAHALEQRAIAMLREYEAQQAADSEEEPADEASDSELPPDLAERLEDIEREVFELREAGRLDAAENLEREARRMVEQYRAELRERDAVREESDGASDEDESRLDHLRAAAEHLEAAGAPDLTERVRGLIEEIEGEQPQ